MTEEVSMTKREIFRENILLEIVQGKITKKEAAIMLGISCRQIHRLYTKYQDGGITSLISKKRGKPSNNQLENGLRERILELVTCDLYQDFGPTYMCEKLQERHGIEISIESVRKLMVQSGVWKPHKKKSPIIHQQRERRAQYGELIQIDGSPERWFEDRGDPCVLITFIDDATGRAFGLFSKRETTLAYMKVLKEYIIKYGCPLALYSDKHGIFRINRPGCVKNEMITQFGRVCKELNIHLICANSPQAKGRIERNHKTQQDRLVKELRLRGISTIEKANEFLIEYWEMFNGKFSKSPSNKKNAHRKISPEEDLNKILCHKESRKLSKNLELQYKNTVYQIKLDSGSRRLQGATVIVIETEKKELYIEYKGENLPFTSLKQDVMGEEVDSKAIDSVLKTAKKKKVVNHHPWKQEGRAQAKMKEFQGV